MSCGSGIQPSGVSVAGTRPALVEDPLECPHVLAEPRAEKLALRVAPEPVHMENLRRKNCTEGSAHVAIETTVRTVECTTPKNALRFPVDIGKLRPKA